MKSSMFAIGIGLMIIGTGLFLVIYNRMAELQTSLGQIARALNESLQSEYRMLQFFEPVAGFLAIAGLGLVIYGATTKTQTRIETDIQSRIFPRSTDRSLSPMTKDKVCCTFCGTMPGENDVFCRKCGKVVPS
jgi:hypothetical protein